MANLLIVDDDINTAEMLAEYVPVLLCSGVLDLPAVARVLGTPYFLSKPYPLDAFSQLLQRALTDRTAPTPRLSPRHS